MTFTGNRFIYSIGISLLKVKDCFQDNSHKDMLFSYSMQTFSRFFFSLLKCVRTHVCIKSFFEEKGCYILVLKRFFDV